MEEYMDTPPLYDVHYGQHNQWGYRTRIRIWTYLQGFMPWECDELCANAIDGEHDICPDCTRKTKLHDRYQIPPMLPHETLESCIAYIAHAAETGLWRTE